MDAGKITRRECLEGLAMLGCARILAPSFPPHGPRRAKHLLLLSSPSESHEYAKLSEFFAKRLATQEGLAVHEVEMQEERAADLPREEFDAALAIGPDAIAWCDARLTEEVPWTYCATFRQLASPEERRVQGALLEVDPDGKIALVQKVFPKVHQVGMLFDPEVNQWLVSHYERACKKRGVRLVARAVRVDDDLVKGLFDITKSCQALILLNDEVNRAERNFKRIRLDVGSRGHANHMFLIGDSLRYASRGFAVFALETLLRDHVFATLKLVEDMVRGDVRQWTVHLASATRSKAVLRKDLAQFRGVTFREELPPNVEVRES